MKVTAPPAAVAGQIWLASYPKSGNTWMRILLSNLMSGKDEEEDINDLHGKGGIATGRGRFAQLSLLDPSILRPAELDRLRPTVHELDAAEHSEMGWHKTHDAWNTLPDGTPVLGRGARAALYLVRDPRDVLVSLAHHNTSALDEALLTLNRSGFSARSAHSEVYHRLGNWSEHVCSWLDQREVPVHLIRYEDLHADTVGVLSRALDMLGVQASPQQVEHAAERASFARLQRQEQEKGFRERVGKHAPFFREGRVGGWREQLNEEQLQRLEAVHADTMRRLSYTPVTC